MGPPVNGCFRAMILCRIVRRIFVGRLSVRDFYDFCWGFYIACDGAKVGLGKWAKWAAKAMTAAAAAGPAGSLSRGRRSLSVVST